MKRLAVAIWLLAVPAFAAGGDPVAETEAAIAALADAEALLARAEKGEDQDRALNAAVAAFEKSLSAIRVGERDLTRAEREMRDELASRQDKVAALLAALIRMRQVDQGAMLVHPGGALGRVQASLVLEAVTPELKAEADGVAALLDDLEILRGALEKAGASTRAGLVRMRWAREELRRALLTRPEAPSDLSEALASVAAASRSLDLLIEGVSALKDEGLPLNLPDPDVATRFGALPLPAEGRVISNFGEPDPQGGTGRGATLVTDAGAFVRAPFDASVRFVGPFLGYGNVIILEPAPDILLVLAGMKEVYIRPEEIVGEGAALGMMGGQPRPGTDAGPTETLYLELRRGGSPVDPAGWFATTRGNE